MCYIAILFDHISYMAYKIRGKKQPPPSKGRSDKWQARSNYGSHTWPCIGLASFMQPYAWAYQELVTANIASHPCVSTSMRRSPQGMSLRTCRISERQTRTEKAERHCSDAEIEASRRDGQSTGGSLRRARQGHRLRQVTIKRDNERAMRERGEREDLSGQLSDYRVDAAPKGQFNTLNTRIRSLRQRLLPLF